MPDDSTTKMPEDEEETETIRFYQSVTFGFLNFQHPMISLCLVFSFFLMAFNINIICGYLKINTGIMYCMQISKE